MVRIITKLKKINFSKYSKPSDTIIKAIASVTFLLSWLTDPQAHTPPCHFSLLRCKHTQSHTEAGKPREGGTLDLRFST